MNTGDVLSMKEVLNYFVRILAWGGNFLLNIGPNSLGIIDPLFEERLRDLGSFTNANGEAIYESKPWIYQNESDYIWYTSKTTGVELDKSRVYNPQLEEATTVYAFVTKFEDKVEFKLSKPTDKTKNTLLGKNTALKFKYENNVLTVSLPSFRNLPRLDCIVLKLENLQADNVSIETSLT
ncbi:unnamed protein product [Bursaphelenchus okinawaensis]|uniref:alpha-L-fucosidase n=1 Tax=Bursaphelenchus okinawaensis TaxID=465554 RepID=A0A811LLH8_9BILA|nr:unnamed protein product [Bursaphelenchus okinawaensis]CAG9125789.1 unnamed protein product [Bursaphelenchus okinawaensis]